MILLPALFRRLTIEQILTMADMPLAPGEALTLGRLRRALEMLHAYEREYGYLPEIPTVEPEPHDRSEWLLQLLESLTDRIAPADRDADRVERDARARGNENG